MQVEDYPNLRANSLDLLTKGGTSEVLSGELTLNSDHEVMSNLVIYPSATNESVAYLRTTVSGEATVEIFSQGGRKFLSHRTQVYAESLRPLTYPRHPACLS